MEHLKNQMVLQIKEDLKDKMQALLAEENEHAQNENEILTMDTSVRAFKFPFKKVTDILKDTLKVRMHEYRSPIFFEGVEEYDGAEYYFYVEGTCVSINGYSTLNSIISRIVEAFFEEKPEQHTSILMADRKYIEKIYQEISSYVAEEINIYNEELELDVPVDMDIPMGYIDDDIYNFVGITLQEVLGIELEVTDEPPKMNVSGDDRFYYLPIGIQCVEITRTKTIKQVILETVSVIADEITSIVTEERLWEHFFGKTCKSEWYRVDGNVIYMEPADIDIGYLLCLLDLNRRCGSDMEELLLQNGYEVKEGEYGDYPCNYIAFPESTDMADGAGDRIWLKKWEYNGGWIPELRPRIEVLTLLAYIIGYCC